ncbi:NUDIX hydrolase [Acetatifactor aquisgranensis]|uniref:NUDIX hydrolase n=1 Tax=Acetatifactor aquisgranensis TaxID=2941233 RepID=UPI00203F4C25|nr:NUDIX hydrolase [Acetatifactor aquisgranensis]
MDILARNRSGWSLLEVKNIEEWEMDNYNRVTGAYAIVCIKGRYLIGFNNWRKQWEFPAGGIEEGEAPKAAAERELWEETHQQVSSFEFKGLAKVMAPDGEIRYQAVYLGYKDELQSFIKQDNDEMDKIMLWDLKEDIGYFDECDLEILKLSCL